VNAKPTQPQTQPQNVAGPPGKTGPRKHILMLEDETDLTDELKPFFAQNGFNLVAVTNGVDGLKQIMARDFSVIVCDMLMPSLPGDMFYRAVERTKPQLCKKFIFITGYKGNRDIEDFIRKIHGVMIWKPFDTQQLMDAVQLILQQTGG
jgi:DNA-binding NtrC family response regulator